MVSISGWLIVVVEDGGSLVLGGTGCRRPISGLLGSPVSVAIFGRGASSAWPDLAG
jgi:hypothetical protein